MKIDKTIASLKTGCTKWLQITEAQTKKAFSSFSINRDLKNHQSIKKPKLNNQHQPMSFNDDNSTDDFVELFKKNRKVLVAGVSAVLTFTIGIYSIFDYIATAPIENMPIAHTANAKLALPEQQHLARIENKGFTKEQIEIPTAANAMIRMSSYLKLPTLFTSYQSCYVLRVNGNVVAYFKTQEEGNQLIANLSASYKSQSGEVLSVGFAEDVQLAQEQVSLYKFTGYKALAEVEQLIKTGTNEKRVYNVQSGDVLSTIAEKHSIGLTQLYAANPGIESKKYLQIGDEINLIVPVPLINVKTVEKITYAEAIPYETINETSSSMYKGETSVKVRGVNGEKQVVAEVVKINGAEQGRTILQEQVSKQPVSRILVAGTKAAPPTIGSGKFSKPVSRSYTISSPFGTRWGSFHTGIDLAMPTGSAVLAADGGKVVFAGTQSSYGKLIIIDHGGNLQSYYAHNSKLLVKKGDKVFKGQKIALSGNTGRSTGPHLHFEIRVNGVPKNPKKYIGF